MRYERGVDTGADTGEGRILFQVCGHVVAGAGVELLVVLVYILVGCNEARDHVFAKLSSSSVPVQSN